jgi:DNA-binding beta-propeller fold protein YncE
MVAQHSPHVLPDGNFAVFDNLGGLDTEKSTRVLEIDSISGVGHTLFPRDTLAQGGDLSSDAQGAIAFSSDGTHMLVAETMGGRVFEVDTATGAPLWQYDSISDLAPFYKSIGKEKSGLTFGRMQAQGARYVAYANYDRLATK